MEIVLMQTDIQWMKVEPNLETVERLMDAHPSADLFVLPEMFPTGFCMEPERVAQPMNGRVVKWMQSTACQRGCAIAGSVPVEENSHYYNRMLFVTPDGGITWYDKRHLFSYGRENHHYASGTNRVVVEYKGFRFLLQVCYDLRFPVWSRNRHDYDVMLYVANWPVARIDVWNTLLKARAMENQSYVIGVNRVGNDPVCIYNGQSAAFDFYGRSLGVLNDGRMGTLSVHIEKDSLEQSRKKFPVLADADVFFLQSETS